MDQRLAAQEVPIKQYNDVFGPESLAVIQKAFNEAWVVLDAGRQLQDTGSRRLLLAHALLSIASDSSTDVAALKEISLKIMAPNYPPLQQRSSHKDAGFVDASSPRNVLERAFELARSGECCSMDAIRRRVRDEGFDPSCHFSGLGIRRQLTKMIKKAADQGASKPLEIRK